MPTNDQTPILGNSIAEISVRLDELTTKIIKITKKTSQLHSSFVFFVLFVVQETFPADSWPQIATPALVGGNLYLRTETKLYGFED